MAKTIIVDSGFLVALVRRDDGHHAWAAAVSGQVAAPWRTCESVLSETFFVAGVAVQRRVAELLRRKLLVSDFSLAAEQAAVLALMEKHDHVPMSLADACLVRMTEIMPDAILLTTDADFRIYRRQVVPCRMP